MKVYDIYRDPEDTNVNYYKEDEHPYFKEDYMYVQLGYVKICEDLSEELKLDYDKLSNIKMKDKFKLNLFK